MNLSESYKKRLSELAGIQTSPIIAYHGTNKNFDAFDISFAGSHSDPGDYGRGIYFDTDKEWAATYSNEKIGYIITAEINLSKPYIIDFVEYKQFKDKVKQGEIDRLSPSPQIESYVQALNRGGADINLNKLISEHHEVTFLTISRLLGSENITNYLYSTGYDGVIVDYGKTKEIVVFDTSKIKIINKEKTSDFYNLKQTLQEGSVQDFEFDLVKNHIQKTINNNGLTLDDINNSNYFIVCCDLWKNVVASIKTSDKKEAERLIGFYKKDDSVWKIYIEKPTVGAIVLIRHEEYWKTKVIKENLNEIYQNIPNSTFWAWVSPNNTFYEVPKLNHKGLIMRQYQNKEFGWDYERVFDQALKDGWVRVIYEKFPHEYRAELSLNSYHLSRVKEVLENIFLDLVKYGRNTIFVDSEEPKFSKRFNTDFNEKEEFLNFVLSEQLNKKDFIFHGTNNAAAYHIQKYGGMKTNAANNNEPFISFTSNIDVANYYANAKGGKSNGVVLRTPNASYFSLSPKYKSNPGHEWISSEEIPLEKLEIKTVDGWVPLKNWDIIDKKIISENSLPNLNSLMNRYKLRYPQKNVLTIVNINKLLARHQLDNPDYAFSSSEMSDHPTRIPKAKEFFQNYATDPRPISPKNSQRSEHGTISLEAPLVYIYNNKLGFSDGRHRTIAMKELGYDDIIIEVPKNQLSLFSELK